MDSDPLAVAGRDGVDGRLDGLEVGRPLVADVDAPHHYPRSVAASRRGGGRES